MAPDGSADLCPANFRKVLGCYPTGVCAVCAKLPDGTLAGMVVGTFTSVSLDPPLVGFFPDRSSTSWPKIATAGKFAVSVLAAGQQDVCKALSSKAADKFAGLAFGWAPNGSPVIEGCVAWVDCRLDSVADAGDHLLVLGRVLDLGAGTGQDPMLFFKGGYGTFSA